MWLLESLSPDLTLMFRLMPSSSKTVGRAPRADFIVDAALVSRLHCRLTLDDGGRLDVEDLGSTNGTWVNGRKIARAPLASGDTVRIGRVEFRVSRPPSEENR